MDEVGKFNESLSLSKCPVVRTHQPGRHQTAVHKKWLAQNNLCVMICHYPDVSGYRYRLDSFWTEKDLFEVGEQSFLIK